jgi:hypothetical protein
MQRRRGRRSKVSRKHVPSDDQDDRPCEQRKLACEPMGCPRRQEAAPGELVRVRDACHTYKTVLDRLCFRAPTYGRVVRGRSQSSGRTPSG